MNSLTTFADDSQDCHCVTFVCVYSVDIDSLDAAVAQDSSLFDISHIPDHLLVEESGKVVFLIGLLDNLREEKHRCLVFSSSRRMLDIVQKVMRNRVSLVSDTCLCLSYLHGVSIKSRRLLYLQIYTANLKQY